VAAGAGRARRHRPHPARPAGRRRPRSPRSVRRGRSHLSAVTMLALAKSPRLVPAPCRRRPPTDQTPGPRSGRSSKASSLRCRTRPDMRQRIRDETGRPIAAATDQRRPVRRSHSRLKIRRGWREERPCQSSGPISNLNWCDRDTAGRRRHHRVRHRMDNRALANWPSARPATENQST